MHEYHAHFCTLLLLHHYADWQCQGRLVLTLWLQESWLRQNLSELFQDQSLTDDSVHERQ